MTESKCYCELKNNKQIKLKKKIYCLDKSLLNSPMSDTPPFTKTPKQTSITDFIHENNPGT